MTNKYTYRSILPNADGRYAYTDDDDAVWRTLYLRQMAALPDVMTLEYLTGVEMLGLSPDKTPQVIDIDARLKALTGAGAQGVPAIIPPGQFYELLADRKFPVATFLRRAEEMDYIEEPDLFHEVFGHCPMLTNRAFADFIQAFGKKAIALGKAYRWHMFRLFWFTIEFGLIHTQNGLRGYGAGIASSPAEAAHAMSSEPLVRDFDLQEVFRTPYRIDIVQPVYFAIRDFDQLNAALDQDIAGLIDQAKAMGDLPALFPAKESA